VTSADKIIGLVREKGGDAVYLPADKIVTGEWVRMKCLFGCSGFGRRFSCPPYTPAPSETKAVLAGYHDAVLIRFDGDFWETTPDRPVSREMTHFVQEVMSGLETAAFQDGLYKAFGYTGHQCGLCPRCSAKEKGAVITDCRNRRLMRPSMEAAGIDVYATCRNAGWELGVLACADSGFTQPMTTVMLLLLE
jgi:predicted metal-binding protein